MEHKNIGKLLYDKVPNLINYQKTKEASSGNILIKNNKTSFICNFGNQFKKISLKLIIYILKFYINKKKTLDK